VGVGVRCGGGKSGGGACWAEAGMIHPTIAASATAARRDAKVIKEPLISNPVVSLT
jgi:hypothetical protein